MIKRFFSGISSPLPISGRGGMSLFFALIALCYTVRLSAQTTDDPFPEVDDHKYSMSMTITCKVKMGEALLKTEDHVTIAVFQGDEIRGKDVLDDYSTKYTDMCMLTVYGDKSNEPLYFKVAISKRVIEVDQGLVYVVNGNQGSYKSPYIIELPEPVVSNPSSEGWSTTCLPFNAEIPDGVTVYAATGIEDRQLQVAKIEGTILPAETPVLIESGNSPVEWLARLTTATKPATNIFKGTTEKTTVEAGSVFTLGHENSSGMIGFWRYTGTTIPANRAYLADIQTEVKGFTWLGGEDGIGLTPSLKREDNAGAWYAIDGRRVNIPSLGEGRAGLTRGIYIRQGRKFVVK